MKNIVLLGATGSIGQSALNVLRQNSDSFNLLGIAFNNNFDIALDIANEFKPDFIFYSGNVTSKDHPLFSFDAKILSRSENLREMIQHPKVDVVISAISGFAGLEASYFAIDAGKIILVANKESIVSAGDLLIPLADKKNTKTENLKLHNFGEKDVYLRRKMKQTSKKLDHAIEYQEDGVPTFKTVSRQDFGRMFREALKKSRSRSETPQ